jgi:hypothetical protein
MIYLVLFKDLYLIAFCDKINFENFKKILENNNKEATYGTAIYMKISSKILKRRICKQNKILMSFFLGGGGDEVRSLLMVFCDEIEGGGRGPPPPRRGRVGVV